MSCEGWSLERELGLPVLRFDLLSERGVRHGLVVREGGRDIDEDAVYRRLADHGKTVVTEQTHSVRSAAVDADFADFFPRRVEVDGLTSGRTGATLTVHTADCAPVFLAVQDGSAVGLLHCGWRGTAAGFLVRAVGEFAERYRTAPSRLVAAIGPRICRKCYPVGPEVAGRFGPEVKSEAGGGRWLLDLGEENRRQALLAGLPEGSVHVSPLCTKCRPDLFHSYRREGAELKGKMVCFIEAGHEEERV